MCLPKTCKLKQLLVKPEGRISFPPPPSPLTVATTGEVMQLWNDLVLPVEKKYSVDNK